MTPIKNIRIIRRPETLNRSGISKTNLYNKINCGTWPPSIALGDRAVGFIEHEIDAVMSAMIAGKNEDELKSLVAELVEQRQATA